MTDGWGESTLTEALERQNDALRQTIAVVDHLTRIALAGADLDRVSDELAAALGWSVLVFDRRLELVSETAPTLEGESGTRMSRRGRTMSPELATVLYAVRDRRLPLRVPAFADGSEGSERIVAPIAVGDSVLGYLVVETNAAGDEEDLELVTVQHAASIYALSLVQAERDAELRARYRLELVEGLLLGRVEGSQADELARLAGLDPGAEHVVVVLEIVGRDRNQSARSLEEALLNLAGMFERLDGDLVAVVRAGGVTAIVPPSGSDEVPADRIAWAMADRLPEITYIAGMSRAVSDPSALARAEAEARRALAVASRLGLERQVTSHAQLGVHRLLLHVPSDELDAFARDTLGPLVEPRSGATTTLLETLSVYLRENANLRRSAEALFVHVNTVTYRLHRIESMTGLSLQLGVDRLLAQIAIEIIRSNPMG